MKKFLSICVTLAAVAALAGCADSGGSKSLLGTTTAGGPTVVIPATFTSAQDAAFAEQMFTGAITGFYNKSTVVSAGRLGAVPVSTTTSYTGTISYYYQGPVSGNMNIAGSFPGSYSSSTLFTTWTLSALTETLNSYSFQSNGVTYVMNGALSLTGTLITYGSTVESQSTLNISGTCTIAGGGVSQSEYVNVSVAVNSTGTGGTMTGTIGGLSINQSF